MKIAYFDCFSGISGDMCLGALISAGVDFTLLKEELAKLPVEGYDLRWEKVKRNGITAANVHVDLLEVNQPERCLADILEIIDGSTLPEIVKEKSKAVFNHLAAAEATIHDTTLEQIHFHEVGAVDAIIDVVGTVLGLYLLGVDKVYASALPMGRGFIKCMHGIIPSPAPATLEILRDVPIYGTETEGELVTPTGAALISVLADDFVKLPIIAVEKVGYGSGKKVMEHPNLLRLIFGESYATGVTGVSSDARKHRHTHATSFHKHVHSGSAHCHNREHDHDHDHSHSHKHGHDHGHDHDHDHDHKHDHGHDHDHDHKHEEIK